MDKLLNYTILTPLSVITWVLVDNIRKGQILTHAHVYEMVASTIHKVTNRVRQIVVARNQRGLPSEQVSILEETLAKERGDMGQLFVVVEDALVGVATGVVDEMAESAEQDGSGEALLRSWGGRWLRVFRRKMAVEEAWVGEMLLVGTEDNMEGVDGKGNGMVVGEIADGTGHRAVRSGGEIANGHDVAADVEDEIL